MVLINDAQKKTARSSRVFKPFMVSPSFLFLRMANATRLADSYFLRRWHAAPRGNPQSRRRVILANPRQPGIESTQQGTHMLEARAAQLACCMRSGSFVGAATVEDDLAIMRYVSEQLPDLRELRFKRA